MTKYIFPEGAQFGRTTVISKVCHIVAHKQGQSAFCGRYLPYGAYSGVPDDMRLCIQCMGQYQKTNQTRAIKHEGVTVMTKPVGKKILKTDINPSHYQFKLNGQIFEVADLMEAHFAEDMHLSQALKYMMRAGRKPSASYVSDVGKCLWWCARALMFKGAKHIELPPGAPKG